MEVGTERDGNGGGKPGGTVRSRGGGRGAAGTGRVMGAGITGAGPGPGLVCPQEPGPGPAAQSPAERSAPGAEGEGGGGREGDRGVPGRGCAVIGETRYCGVPLLGCGVIGETRCWGDPVLGCAVGLSLLASGCLCVGISDVLGSPAVVARAVWGHLLFLGLLVLGSPTF